MAKIDGHQVNFEDLEKILGGTISYEKLIANFEISKIDNYNMASDTVDRQAAALVRACRPPEPAGRGTSGL